MKCPNCHECPFERGVCERLANRGRRFFLMGALALPVAAKIVRVAPIGGATPKFSISTARIEVNGRTWSWQIDEPPPQEGFEALKMSFSDTWAVAV